MNRPQSTGSGGAGGPKNTTSGGGSSVSWFDVDDGTELPLATDFTEFVARLTAAASFDLDVADGSRSAS
ncbi:hypothetical protein [Streptomyces sp. NPDC001774]